MTTNPICLTCELGINPRERILCVGCRSFYHINCMNKNIDAIGNCPVCDTAKIKQAENLYQPELVESQPLTSTSSDFHMDHDMTIQKKSPSLKIHMKPPRTKTTITSVRQSVRKTKRKLQDEFTCNIQKAVREGIEGGLEVRIIPEKGRALFATKNFKRGEFVAEYAGDLIGLTEARYREYFHASRDASGSSYMFYFRYKEQTMCVDATSETGRMGRLVNHSRYGNLTSKTLAVDGSARLLLIAKNDIFSGTELTIDYGDRSKKSLKAHPWLAN